MGHFPPGQLRWSVTKASSHFSSMPFVSGNVQMAQNASTAPAATYQKNTLECPASDNAVFTSGAVPPNVATVTLYQAPMPRARTSVGNISLMIAGAIEVI